MVGRIVHRPLAFLLLCVMLLLGCRAESTPTAASVLEDMLRILPADTTEVVYYEMDAIYDDDDFTLLLEEVEDSWDEYFEDDFDIELDDLAYFVVGENDDDLFLLGGLGGDDLNAIRSELAFIGYDDDEIRDVEVWIDTSESWESVAFLDSDRVLMAKSEDAMDDAIRRMDGEAFSLYDRVGDIVSDLPSGVLAANISNTSTTSSAIAIGKKGPDEMEVVAILLYENEDDAETAETAETARENLSDCSDVNVARNGKKVTISIVCEVDILVDAGFPLGL